MFQGTKRLAFQHEHIKGFDPTDHSAPSRCAPWHGKGGTIWFATG
jgi:hypothetical protein